MNDLSLRPWSSEDLPVLQRSNTPEMTTYLGGPETDEKVLARHEKYLRLWEEGEARSFVVIDSHAPVPVGSIGYWKAEWDGRDVYETGWSIATAYQGRGLGAKALLLCLQHAAAHGDRDLIVAFPRIDNLASNAVARVAGFTNTGEEDSDYPPGVPIRVNAWIFDLSEMRRRSNGSSD